MDTHEKQNSTTTQKSAARGILWPFIALVAIAVASWTVKTTFGPEKVRYFSFGVGDFHLIYQFNTETGELKKLFPRN